ncbi:Transcriptional repressor for NAD biosynthesis in gram-positive [Lachnospiraceae bacterium TWA4]|nr:Transcriptional repressor for NAD biosynthesis in gram-positive [Lachnospiraceae bacterium TWA4]
MNGEQRRENILHILSTSQNPVAGDRLAKSMQVSRQVIVQDIALLRANGQDIVSTNRGYLLQCEKQCVRVLKVFHTDEQTEEEMSTIVDFGGRIQDVFVYHKVYGVLRAEMNIKSRRDIKLYLQEMSTGKSSLLKNITGGYHYHTIYAESTEILDDIQNELMNKGFLAKLQDYEPVDFWSGN